MKSLSIQKISKSFGNTSILNEFSMEIISGGITALTGESGSGKTTILRLIAGLERVDAGIIKMDNEVINNLSPQKRKIGFVFQDLALFPHLTVEKNILFGVSKNASKNKLEELLELTDLNGLAHRYPHELSGGQQQRVALARALATEPELLLMDEPFSSLDERIKNKVRTDLFKIIKKLGLTTIIVTHHATDAFAIADKIAILKSGKLIQYDDPATIYQRPKNEYVSALFGSGIVFPIVIKNGEVNCSFGQFTAHSNWKDGHAKLFIRPESVQIVAKKSADIKGKIQSKSFKGPHDLMIIEDTNQANSFEFESERVSFNIGDILGLKLDLDKAILF